jgi:hypothetical protein
MGTVNLGPARDHLQQAKARFSAYEVTGFGLFETHDRHSRLLREHAF